MRRIARQRNNAGLFGSGAVMRSLSSSSGRFVNGCMPYWRIACGVNETQTD
jgi:hypothetical protein